MLGALIGFIVLLLDLPARLLVLVLAIWGKYPWWLITPDDPVTPMGIYEPKVFKAYYGREPTPKEWANAMFRRKTTTPPPIPSAWRRYWGDVVWLAWRNVLFGLSMYFKPDSLDIDGRHPNYVHLCRRKISGGWYTIYCLGGFSMLTIRYGTLFGRPIGGMFGYKIDGAVDDPVTLRVPGNAEGRPIFSLIRVLD